MTPLLGLVAVSLGIVALFRLERDNVHLATAIWIPFIWLLIAFSRPVSSWLTFSGPSDVNASYIDGSPLDRNVLTSLLLLGVFALFKKKRQVAAVLKGNVPIIAFFLYCLISLVWADFPLVVAKRWIRSVGDIVMILVIITEPNWEAALKIILMRVGFVLIPLSILFIRFYPSLGRGYSIGGAPTWTGVATDKNALGALCMLIGVSLLWRGLAAYRNRGEPHRKRRLGIITVVFAMVIYLLLVANSQTALSCFLMASLLIVITAIPALRSPSVISLVVAVMLITSFCVLFLGIGGGALTTLGRNASLTGRTDVWRTLLPFAVNPWLGAGYENFWIGDRLDAIFRILGRLNQAHNGYIEEYLNIGWVGLFLLATVIVAGYRNIMSGLRSSPDMSRLKLAFWFICMVYNFTEASFKMTAPVWILFLWAVMATPKARPRKQVGMPSNSVSQVGQFEPRSGTYA